MPICSTQLSVDTPNISYPAAMGTLTAKFAFINKMSDAPKPSEKPPAQKDDMPAWSIEQLKKKTEELLLSWGPTGLIMAWAVHLGTVGQWKEAALAFGIAGIVSILTKFYTKLDPKLDKLFAWIADNFESWVLSTWWKVTANFQGKYYEQLIFNCQDFRTQGLKTKGAFTLDLEKVFVPLQVASESADKISSDMMREKASQRCLEIWDFLAQIYKKRHYRYIVIIGPPGSGKTTLLEHLTLMYARNAQRRQHRKAPSLIPVLLYLRTVRDRISSDTPPNLAELITQQSDIAKLNPKQWFSEKLRQGKCLVMLDGLDEVADETQRRNVSRWIDEQIRAYPRNAFLLTSRPFGYRNAALEKISTVLEMQQFSLKQTKQFIQNWYLQNEIMDDLCRDKKPRENNLFKFHCQTGLLNNFFTLHSTSYFGEASKGVRQIAKTGADKLISQIQKTPTLATMAINPLLLTMIATVHRFRGSLPGQRVELYREICDVLLERRQEVTRIPEALTAFQKQSVLQALALALMQQLTREFTPEQGGDLIREKLKVVAGGTIQPAEFLKAIAYQTGLLVEREQGIYEFVHKSFQEYLSAVEIKETNQEVLLTQKVGNDWWFETIRLYAAQSNASALIKAALEQGSVPALMLAVNCLDEPGQRERVDPKIRESLKERIEGGLESTDPELFKLAAEVKLAGRFKRLIRIDDSSAIDETPIICAEYQLFIDAQHKRGINKQPDHWIGYRFVPGDAAKPITGVRASDAEEFCQWLSGQGHGLCRLPQVSEAREYPVLDSRVGYWCMSSNGKTIEGISRKQGQAWKRRLSEKLTLDRDIAQNIAHELDIDRNLIIPHDLNLDLDLDLDLETARNCSRDLDLPLASACEVIHALSTDYNRVRDDRARKIVLERDRAHARVLDREKALMNHASNFQIEADYRNPGHDDIARILDSRDSLSEADYARSVDYENAYQKAYQKAHRDRARDLESCRARAHALDREVARSGSLDRDITLDRVSNIARALDRARNIALDLALDQSLIIALDCAIKRTLDNHNLRDTAIVLKPVRNYLLAIAVSWNLISEVYERAKQEQGFMSHKSLSRQKCETYSRKGIRNRDTVMHLYLFFLLLDLRKTGQMPSWESIRIVGEQQTLL